MVTPALPSPSHAEPDLVDFGEVWHLLHRRAPVIIAVMLLFAAATLALMMVAVPQFSAEGAIYLGDAKSAGTTVPASYSSDLGMPSSAPDTSDVGTQLELLTANGLVEQAVIESGLNADITPARSKKITFWRWKFQFHSNIEAFRPHADSLQARYGSVPGAYRLILGDKGRYQIFTRPGLLRKPRFILQGTLGLPAAGNGLQILIEPAVARPNLTPGTVYNLNIYSTQALVSALLGGALSANSGGSITDPTKIAFVHFRWADPYKGAAFVNQLLQDFIANQLSWKSDSASNTENFVTSQLKTIGNSLTAAESKLASYQANTGIVNVEQNSSSLVGELDKFKSQLSALQLQKESLEKLNQALQSSSSPINPFLVSQTDDPVLTQLVTSLTTANVELAGLAVKFTGQSAEVRTQEATVAQIESQIRSVVANDLAAANRNLTDLNKIINQFNADIKAAPAESLKVQSLQRTTDVLGKLYVMLKQVQQEAAVAKAAAITNTRIITAASPPLGPTTPKVTISVLFAAVVGLVIGLGSVLGHRWLSGRFESENEIRRLVPVPIFAALPPPPLPSQDGDAAVPVGQARFDQALRLLRSHIYRRLGALESAIILVVSPSKRDRCSIVASGLAKTLVEDRRRVALINSTLSDLRLQDLPHLPALADNARSLSEAVLEQLFSRLRRQYEFIILDCPPCPEVADGVIMAPFADLLISVAAVSQTSRSQFLSHCQTMSTLERNYGVVINLRDERHLRGTHNNFIVALWNFLFSKMREQRSDSAAYEDMPVPPISIAQAYHESGPAEAESP